MTNRKLIGTKVNDLGMILNCYKFDFFFKISPNFADLGVSNG